jgi:hypothetical protein
MGLFLFQVNSNISDKANDLKQLREQIRRLDEQLEQDMQVGYIFNITNV